MSEPVTPPPARIEDANVEELRAAVQALMSRVDALEAGSRPSDRDADLTAAAAGRVGYSGSVDLVGHIEWSYELDARSVLAVPAAQLADVFAALGHPARLDIVRILLQGNASVAQLQDQLESTSSGQLYHHLTALVRAGLVAKTTRSEYQVAPQRVVPTLTLLLAAADVADVFRSAR